MKRARTTGKKEKLSRSVQGNKSVLTEDDFNAIIEEIQEDKKSGKVKKKTKKNKKKFSFKKFLGTFLCFALLIGIFGMGFNLFDDEDVLAPLEDGKINVLLLGVDESGLRTDAIMVASYDVNKGEVNMLSIPRDTKTYIVNRKEFKKINGIHAIPAQNKGEILGVQATAEAVTGLTGIPINYYVEFSFLSIDHLFDNLGPVEFDVPDVEKKGRGMNYDDPYQNLHIHLEPGLQKLSGNQVQQFLRYRKSNYHIGTGSDTDRVKRQQDFIKAVIDQKVNMTIIPKLPGIYIQLAKEIRTNINMGDITKYIRYVNRLSSDKIHSYSLPGEAKMISGASYFVCDISGTKKLVGEVFGYNGEISERITISGENPHKPLKAGNMQKPDVAGSKDLQKTTDTKTEQPEKKKQDKEEVPVKEEKAEEQKEEEEKLPEPEPNQTPLEEIYNLDD